LIKKIGINELETGMDVCGVGKGPGEDLFFMNNILIRVKDAGGKIIVPKTPISPDMGFFGMFIDSEGNKMAVHSFM